MPGPRLTRADLADLGVAEPWDRRPPPQPGAGDPTRTSSDKEAAARGSRASAHWHLRFVPTDRAARTFEINAYDAAEASAPDDWDRPGVSVGPLRSARSHTRSRGRRAGECFGDDPLVRYPGRRCTADVWFPLRSGVRQCSRSPGSIRSRRCALRPLEADTVPSILQRGPRTCLRRSTSRCPAIAPSVGPAPVCPTQSSFRRPAADAPSARTAGPPWPSPAAARGRRRLPAWPRS